MSERWYLMFRPRGRFGQSQDERMIRESERAAHQEQGWVTVSVTEGESVRWPHQWQNYYAARDFARKSKYPAANVCLIELRLVRIDVYVIECRPGGELLDAQGEPVPHTSLESYLITLGFSRAKS